MGYAGKGHAVRTSTLDTLGENRQGMHAHLFSLEKWMIQSFYCRETLVGIHDEQLRDLLAHTVTYIAADSAAAAGVCYPQMSV